MGRSRGGVDPEHDARLQLALGWQFDDPALLAQALTHRSYCSEQGLDESNERLEFLGDSVLRFVVTDHRLRSVPPRFPRVSWRSCGPRCERGDGLAIVAGELDVGRRLRLGKGEDASGGRAKP